MYDKNSNLTICMLGNYLFVHVFLSSVDYFQNKCKKKIGNTISVTLGLYPDQARHFLGPDLGLNCLQRLSVKKRLKKYFGNTIRETNGLYPDQARHFVGPDLGLNCLKRLSVKKH